MKSLEVMSMVVIGIKLNHVLPVAMLPDFVYGS